MKLTKPNSENLPAPGAAEAEQLDALFIEAQNGLRRVVALGLFCFEIKSRIKHGQFMDWLQDNSVAAPFRSLRAYMEITKSVLEACGFQIASALAISHGGQILLLADAEVPKESRELREKICSVIDGKTQRQLLLEFRTPKEDQKAQHHPRKHTAPLTPGEELALNKKMATEHWLTAEEHLKSFARRFSALEDMEVQAATDFLDTLSSALKTWTRQPRRSRDFKPVETVLQRLGI